MKTIKINDKEYKVKYTIRALFYWEQITGKPFAINTLLDNYLFFYCMILANNPDDVLEWDQFLNAIDNDPTLFSQINSTVEDSQKKDELFNNEEEIEIQRNDLAQTFNCVPSEINYVIATRFKPSQGYYVESRRGGGGHITIKKVSNTKSDYIMHIIENIGETGANVIAARSFL